MTIDDDGTTQNTALVWLSETDGKWHAAIGTAAGLGIERTGHTAATALLNLAWAIMDTGYRFDPSWSPPARSEKSEVSPDYSPASPRGG